MAVCSRALLVQLVQVVCVFGLGCSTDGIARLSACNLQQDKQKCAKVHLNAENTGLPVFKAWCLVRRDSNNRICPHLTNRVR